MMNLRHSLAGCRMGASWREFRGNLEQKLINGIAREVYF